MVDHFADFVGYFESERSQGAIEWHGGAALLFAVKEIAGLDAARLASETLFETDGLAAELDLIGAVGFGATAFILYGNEGAVFVDFDDVAHTTQSVSVGPYGETARNAHSRPRLAEPGVRFFMQCVAFGGREILCPHALDMNQRALPRAIQVVL